MIACFPVYRTYVTAGEPAVSEHDRRYIVDAVQRAKRRNPGVTTLVFDFIAASAAAADAGHVTGGVRGARRGSSAKFQQITSPVAAKGIEDTARTSTTGCCR